MRTLTVVGIGGSVTACTVPLGSLGGTSAAWDVNDSGLIVGTSIAGTIGNSPAFAVKFLSGGRVVKLPAPPGLSTCVAARVAADGTIAGMCFSSADSHQHAVRWDPADAVQDLGQLAPGFDMTVSGINRHGVIVGFAGGGSFTPQPADRAWVYDPAVGSFDELRGTPNAIQVTARDINDAGDIVGTIVETTDRQFELVQRAVKWVAPNRQLVFLQTSIACFASANAINNHGWIVGNCGTKAGIHRTACKASVSSRLPCRPFPPVSIVMG